jgi:anaerobic glycerol-3-phosphate dehydrogenase
MDPFELHIYDFDRTLYYPRSNRWHSGNVVRAQRSIDDPRIAAVLLTARADYRQGMVESMLASASLQFDMVKLQPVAQSFRNHAHYKAVSVEKMLRRFPTVRKVVFYDDRRENLNAVGVVVRGAGLAFEGVS